MSNVEDPTLLRAKINAETAQIAWTGVQRFFAQGKAIYVHPSADLVEVALESLSRGIVRPAPTATRRQAS